MSPAARMRGGHTPLSNSPPCQGAKPPDTPLVMTALTIHSRQVARTTSSPSRHACSAPAPAPTPTQHDRLPDASRAGLRRRRRRPPRLDSSHAAGAACRDRTSSRRDARPARTARSSHACAGLAHDGSTIRRRQDNARRATRPSPSRLVPRTLRAGAATGPALASRPSPSLRSTSARPGAGPVREHRQNAGRPASPTAPCTKDQALEARPGGKNGDLQARNAGPAQRPQRPRPYRMHKRRRPGRRRTLIPKCRRRRLHCRRRQSKPTATPNCRRLASLPGIQPGQPSPAGARPCSGCALTGTPAPWLRLRRAEHLLFNCVPRRPVG